VKLSVTLAWSENLYYYGLAKPEQSSLRAPIPNLPYTKTLRGDPSELQNHLFSSQLT